MANNDLLENRDFERSTAVTTLYIKKKYSPCLLSHEVHTKMTIKTLFEGTWIVNWNQCVLIVCNARTQGCLIVRNNTITHRESIQSSVD